MCKILRGHKQQQFLRQINLCILLRESLLSRKETRRFVFLVECKCDHLSPAPLLLFCVVFFSTASSIALTLLWHLATNVKDRNEIFTGRKCYAQPVTKLCCNIHVCGRWIMYCWMRFVALNMWNTWSNQRQQHGFVGSTAYLGLYVGSVGLSFGSVWMYP
jgi:hypothetical protein